MGCTDSGLRRGDLQDEPDDHCSSLLSLSGTAGQSPLQSVSDGTYAIIVSIYLAV